LIEATERYKILRLVYIIARQAALKLTRIPHLT